MHLVAVIDWYSRCAVAWELDRTIEVPFVLRAVRKALARSKPEIFDSDQSSQFTSPEYTGLLKEAGGRISMDGRGRATDNVFTERLWRSLKCEKVYLNVSDSPREARQHIGRGGPKHGYSALFAKMTAHPSVCILLNIGYRSIADEVKFGRLIYTGPIDESFDHVHGRLPYRSLWFEFETVATETFQPVGIVNYPNDYDFTRITESRHLTGQTHPHTNIVREYPQPQGEPYYPVSNEESQEIYRRYAHDAEKLSTVWFVGRIANYRYFNMDHSTWIRSSMNP